MKNIKKRPDSNSQHNYLSIGDDVTGFDLKNWIRSKKKDMDIEKILLHPGTSNNNRTILLVKLFRQHRN